MFFKKIIATVLATNMALIVLAGSISVVNADNEYVTFGKCGDNAEWFINSDETLVITGTGTTDESQPWNLYVNDIQKVVVENGIVSLSLSDFTDCKNITEAVFSSSVVNLNCCLSSDMSKLKDIWIYADNMENTFIGDENLYPLTGSGTKWHIYQNTKTEKSLRDGLSLTDEDIEYITENQQFPVIENRTPVELPEVTDTSGPSGLNSKYTYDKATKTLTFSGKGAISIADNYTKYAETTEHIVMKSGITIIKAYGLGEIGFRGAFTGFKQLKDVQLPDTLKIIGDYSFCGTPLTNIINGLPEGLETIEQSAFRHTNLYGDLVLPQTLDYIGDSAFVFTNITSVNLNKGMYLGGQSFYGCNFIKEVTIPKDLIYILTSTSNAGRPNAAFYSCESLERVIIKGGGILEVQQSSNPIRNGLGQSLFSGCTSLKEIIIYSKDIEYIDDYTFDMTNNPTFYICNNCPTKWTLRDAGYLRDDNTVYIAEFLPLDEAIEEAEGMDLSNYTDESVSALNEALENGRAVLNDLTSSQETVDNAVKAIKEAIKALEEKKEPSSSEPTSDEPSSDNSSDNSTEPTSKDPTTSPTNTPNVTTKPNNSVAQAKANAEKIMNQAKITKLKVKSKAKKKIVVSWKKVNKAVGYEVQVAKNNKFKKNKIVFDKFTKKKKLIFKNKIKSGTTYFVRVRAYATYKDENNKARKVYSKWIKKVRKVKVR